MSEQDAYGYLEVDHGDYSVYVTDEDGNTTVIFEFSGDGWFEAYSCRTAACVNACTGMDDPAKEIAKLREQVDEWKRVASEQAAMHDEAASRLERAEEALRRLMNEVFANLGFAEYEIRHAIGNTNYHCLESRANEARAYLTEKEEE